jgi:UTP--glucose-1-phosphate uridylyltransferase
MTISKALITAAGRNQRYLPLQTLVERDGYPRPVLSHLIEEVLSAGIESIGVVICPGDQDLYRRAAGDQVRRLTLIEQQEPNGYAGAISCGREFLGGESFLLMVSDHLFISQDATRSCARQLVDAAIAEKCAMSAVQATHESHLAAFGAVGGRLFDSRPGLYEVERVIEKPTPTQAEQELIVPGLRVGHYLCFLGMHVLGPSVPETLAAMLADAPDPTRVHLADALNALDERERYLAIELAGRRYDLDEPYGLLTAQLALALDGGQRAEVLAKIVSLLAEVRPQ